MTFQMHNKLYYSCLAPLSLQKTSNNNLNKYIIKDEINESTFGSIMIAFHKELKINVAIKINNIIIESESRILKILNCKERHNNIIYFYESIIFNYKQYIITEYINGCDLFNYICNFKYVNVTNIINIAAQIISALYFLKNHNIIHCDLKPENIMIEQNTNNIKIIDFGSAIINDKNNNVKCITYIYQTPEYFNNKIISFSTDIWALGCILYTLITKQHPFDLMCNLTKKEIINNIIYQPITFNQKIWITIPAELKILISNMLNKKIECRLSIENIYEQFKQLNYI